MANQGWPSTAGSGSGWSSTARQSGRETSLDDAESFIKPVVTASTGSQNDPMDKRSDLYVPATNG